MDYNIDMVMCIDGSAKMRPVIEKVKKNVFVFYEKVVNAFREFDRDVGEVRIKVIVFRDFAGDERPMEESEFFVLPEQIYEFLSFVQGIKAVGGGANSPENALEAVILAMKSDWTKGGVKRRHMILVYTDSEALPLGKRADCPGYPAGMPADLKEMQSWWEGDVPCENFSTRSSGLIAFAPNVYPWSDLCCFNRYCPAYSKAGTDISEIDFINVFDFFIEGI